MKTMNRNKQFTTSQPTNMVKYEMIMRILDTLTQQVNDLREVVADNHSRGFTPSEEAHELVVKFGTLIGSILIPLIRSGKVDGEFINREVDGDVVYVVVGDTKAQVVRHLKESFYLTKDSKIRYTHCLISGKWVASLECGPCITT